MAKITKQNTLRLFFRRRCKSKDIITLIVVGIIFLQILYPRMNAPLEYPRDFTTLHYDHDGKTATGNHPNTDAKDDIKKDLEKTLAIDTADGNKRETRGSSDREGNKGSPLKEDSSPPHHCINDDFQPKHKVGVWTMLNDNPDYVRGALKMGRGVKKHTTISLDLVVMELQSKPLTAEEWVDLREAGFSKCIVESIPAPAKTRHDLKEKFAVLHVWAMVVYDTVLFLDADTWVQNSLDSLINLDLHGKTIGVTKDIRERKWVSTFNSGVLLLHPSLDEYNRLRNLLSSGIVYEYIMSDQGFLNEVYKDDWHEIGFVNNANLALYRFQRDFWDKYPPGTINVIHYTMKKPWKCGANDRTYGPICKVWVEAD